ncbi:MAG: hypothetical protein H6650_06290 [Ardenticatenales bacterium]|nr:hypothetical protein [Ardenticatenales bacterium]
MWADPCAPGGGGNGPLSGGWYEVEITGQNQPPITLIIAAESYDTGWLLLLPDSYNWRARSCQDEDCVQSRPLARSVVFHLRRRRHPHTTKPTSPRRRRRRHPNRIRHHAAQSLLPRRASRRHTASSRGRYK